MTPPRSVDGGEVAPSSIVGRQLGIWLASGVDGDACRHADLGSARNKLAANASALGHVSAKKLVGETQYWKVPHIQVDRGDPSFIPLVNGRSVIKSKDTSVHFFSGIFVDWSFPRFKVWSDFAT